MTITRAMTKIRLGDKPTNEIETEIERLQDIQKRHHHAHPLWKIASAELAWLFVEMDRRTM